ncbi:MAG TPA: PQQ-binding-like beta-propeller repeat protein, partial [Blastocatellia bacterium]|nr:PQQ-binding-like beta-propeller repeat protein [Blastocatellia bacterium]
MKFRCVFSILLSLALAQATTGRTDDASDWPQWRGADRTGLSKETGLLKSWPSEGPPVVWSISNLGEGYGSIAIKGDGVFVQGAKGSDSAVFCLSRSDGKTLWSQALGPLLDQDRGGGPRGTPTVDGDRVYALTENGDLACLRASDGSIVWRKNILKEFKGRNINWLISESPLIDGNNLIVTPGGSGAGIVALDKMTGKTVWTSKELSDPAGYASCLAVNVGGVRTI